MDKDYAFSQNYNYRRSALVLSIRLITLIPREGTETHIAVALVVAASVLITLIPREGTETFRIEYFQDLSRFFELITLIPREGTETLMISRLSNAKK